jgi:hypothetical protein
MLCLIYKVAVIKRYPRNVWFCGMWLNSLIVVQRFNWMVSVPWVRLRGAILVVGTISG